MNMATKEYNRAYYLAHKAEAAKRNREYYLAHKDEIKAKRLRKVEGADAEEKRRAYLRAYYLAHREEIRARQWIYYHTYLSKEAREKRK